MKSLFRIAYRNVKLNWRHSLAAILSIVASFFSLILFEGYMRDVADVYYDGYRYRSMYGDVIIENKDLFTVEAKAEPWKFYLDQKQQSAITEFLRGYESSILASVHFLSLQGMISNGRTSTIFFGSGHDLVDGAKMRQHWAWNTLYGNPLYTQTMAHPIVVGQHLGEVLGCDPEKRISVVSRDGGYIPVARPFHCYRDDIQLSLSTDQGQLNAMDFNIVGMVDAGYLEVDSKFLAISLQDAQTLLNTNKISFQTVGLKDPTQTDNFMADFRDKVISKDPSLEIIRWKDHRVGEMYVKTLNLLSVFRNFVVVVILTISILSVMNTMVKIIKERTREVGTLLSMGFQRYHILMIFVTESIFLGLIGCVIGGIGSLVTTLTLNKMGILYRAGMLSEPIFLKVKIAPLDYVAVVIMLLLVSAVTTAFSIQSTLRKKIVDCLIY